MKDVNELARKFLNCKTQIGELEGVLEDSKLKLLDAVVADGSPKGKHLMLVTDLFSITREKRETVSVSQEKAVEILLKKNMQKQLERTSVIEIKPGVPAESIPNELLEEMKKYFNVKTTFSVTKDTWEALKATDLISESEYTDGISVKEAFILKVVAL